MMVDDDDAPKLAGIMPALGRSVNVEKSLAVGQYDFHRTYVNLANSAMMQPCRKSPPQSATSRRWRAALSSTR